MSKALRLRALHCDQLGFMAFVGVVCYAGTSNLRPVPEPGTLKPGTLTLLLAGLGVVAVQKALKRC